MRDCATATQFVTSQHIHQRSQSEMLDATELDAGLNRPSAANKKDIHRANMDCRSLISAALTVFAQTMVTSYLNFT